AWLHHNGGDDALPEIAVRHPNHRGFEYSFQIVYFCLNFLWIDIVAARDDEVLAPANNLHIALLVDRPEVTRDEEAVVSEFHRGLFRVAPVPLEHVRAANFDDPDLPLRQRLSGSRISNPQFHPRQRKAHRTRNPLTFERIG